MLAAVLVAVGACSDDDEASDATTAVTEAPTTTARPTTTTTSTTTTTTVPETTTTDAPETTDESTDTTDETDPLDTLDETMDSTLDSIEDELEETLDTLEDRIDAIEEALEAGDFSMMLEALDLTGLADDMEDEEVTILAPTDDAFGELSASEYADLLTDSDELEQVFNRHVIDELITYEELAERTEITVRSGETLPVAFEDGVLRVAGAIVTEPEGDELEGDEGQEVIVLSIDTVLLEVD
jgi:uncharacterized surface protein with fasciclin (FAS1) repeats